LYLVENYNLTILLSSDRILGQSHLRPHPSWSPPG
jgi:hypothetical protein